MILQTNFSRNHSGNRLGSTKTSIFSNFCLVSLASFYPIYLHFSFNKHNDHNLFSYCITMFILSYYLLVPPSLALLCSHADKFPSYLHSPSCFALDDHTKCLFSLLPSYFLFFSDTV
jgi:hypothetical protein